MEGGIRRIMKEFAEKLIERLEELYDRNDKTKKIAYKEQDWEKFDLFTHRCEGIYSAIAIVNDLASEYNNGWIPCEERLPEETEQYSTKYDPITLAEVDVEWYTVSDLVNVIVKNYDTDEVFVCDDCTVDGKWANFGSYPFEVLAWQPMPELPEKYKKGNEDVQRR